MYEAEKPVFIEACKEESIKAFTRNLESRGLDANKENLKGCFKGWIPPCDWKNEYAAWMMIQNLCSIHLKNYP